jgi:hypothetical protein
LIRVFAQLPQQKNGGQKNESRTRLGAIFLPAIFLLFVRRKIPFLASQPWRQDSRAAIRSIASRLRSTSSSVVAGRLDESPAREDAGAPS